MQTIIDADDNMSIITETTVDTSNGNEDRSLSINTAKTCMEYYAVLTEMATERNFKGNFTIPENIHDILMDCGNSKGLSIQNITGFYVIIQSLYREKTIKRKVEDPAKKKYCSNQQPYAGEMEVTELVKGIRNKFSRQDIVPEYTYQFTSINCRIATMMFCMNEYKNDILLCGINALLQNEYKTVNSVLELSKGTFHDMKDKLGKCINVEEPTDVNVKTKPIPNDNKTNIMQTILRISDLINDRTLSCVALEYDIRRYIILMRAATKKHAYHTIAPFWALFNNYIKNCVVLFQQKQKLTEITNQFKVNPSVTVELVASEVEASLQAKDNEDHTKYQKFNDTQLYQVYESEKMFQHLVTLSYIDVGDDTYQVTLYNDCIYDVIGSRKLGLFLNKNWLDRLNSIETAIPMIVIQNRLGKYLNNDNKRNVYLGVSWMENGKFQYHSVHKKAIKRANKQEN